MNSIYFTYLGLLIFLVLNKNWVQSFNLEVELNVLVLDGEPADLLVGLASEPPANAGEYRLCWSQKSSLILQLVSQLDFNLQCKYMCWCCVGG